jgi:hypothetical protein
MGQPEGDNMLKKTYEWKELSSDGLLKEPEPCGPHYSQSTVNPYSGGYDTKKEAEEGFELFIAENDEAKCCRFILCKTYFHDET